ncbi:MAG: protein translocase subunit SecF [Actinomycetota bacterium]
MSRALDTFRGNRVPRLRIIEHRRWWFILSGILIVLSVVGLFFPGLKLSIDFEGGAIMRFPNQTGVSVADVSATMATAGRPEAEVQIVAGDEISIRTETLDTLGDKRGPMLAELATQAGITSDEINIEDVGPTWGSQIFKRMVLALVIFVVLVTIYIAFRFEGKMALGALVALFHDIIITAGVYVLLGREVTPETIIAILTILGFSLYDTVVIYDKVKENTESPALIGRYGYSGVVNLSLNQTIMRSVNTSLVVLLPIAALLLLGGDTLKDFAFALFIGVLVGTYSSIFVAAPLLAALKEREPRYRQRGADPRAKLPAGGVTKGAAVPARAGRSQGSTAAGAAPVVAPRPRKKKSTAAKKKKR